MRLLVTGATGYLGWRTTTLLRARGHEVVALARPGHRQPAGGDAVGTAGAGERDDLVPALVEQLRGAPAEEAGRAGDEEPHDARRYPATSCV